MPCTANGAPQRFADVVGQAAHRHSTCRTRSQLGAIGHAYLFTGTRGTGKTTCAKIFAKARQLPGTRQHADPCGECEICRGIDDGAVMDVVEMDAASNNGVDDIRDLRDEVDFICRRCCKYRVYIIDEVHMLSTRCLQRPAENDGGTAGARHFHPRHH